MNSQRKPIDPILFWTAVLAGLAIYYVLLVFFDRTIFSPRPGRVVESMDGFQHSLLSFEAGISTDELWLALRYYISWPLFQMDRTGYGPIYQGTYLLLYSMPIILYFQRSGRYSYLQLFVIFIPIFINFRLAICIYSTLYLCIFALDKKPSKFLFLWYATSLVLSSSTMFVFILFFPLLGWRRLSESGLGYKFMVTAIYTIISTEFYGKISALFERSVSGEVLSTAGDAGLGYAGSLSGFIGALISGNPFFTAVTYGQYDRLFILIPSVAFGIFFVAYLARIRNYKAVVFLLVLMSSMLSEGVGSYSLSVAIAFMLLRWRDLIIPHSKLQTGANLQLNNMPVHVRAFSDHSKSYPHELK